MEYRHIANASTLWAILKQIQMDIRNRNDLFNFIEFSSNWIDGQFYFVSDEHIEHYIKYYESSRNCNNIELIEYPYEYVYQIPFILKKINETYIEIELYLNYATRFHFVKRIIPKNWITCIINHESLANRPEAIISKEKYEELALSIHSIYVLIDFVGTKKMIFDEGNLSNDLFNEIFNLIDQYAKENPEIIFLTFADNIVLKYDWSYKDYKNFAPEKILLICKKIKEELLELYSIVSYAVASQGVNYLNYNMSHRTQSVNNHILFPSISTPFIEIITIENDVREKIKQKKLEPKDLYIEKSLFLCLDRIFDFKENSDNIKYEKTTKNIQNIIEYLPIEFPNLSQLLNCP